MKEQRNQTMTKLENERGTKIARRIVTIVFNLDLLERDRELILKGAKDESNN